MWKAKTNMNHTPPTENMLCKISSLALRRSVIILLLPAHVQYAKENVMASGYECWSIPTQVRYPMCAKLPHTLFYISMFVSFFFSSKTFYVHEHAYTKDT